MKNFVGIDHGTTFSAVSALLPPATVPTIVEIGQNEPQIPTAIFVDSSTTPPKITVGTEADNQTANKPADVLKWYKPLMETDPAYKFGNHSLPEIATAVLQSIKRDVEAKLNEPLDRAMLTVPAWFHAPAREMTLDAAKRAGIGQVLLEDEPTAAAFFYHKVRRLGPDEILAVYDLGGGTFDVSIVKHDRDGKLQVLASHGDMKLGGHLWTLKLLEDVGSRYIAAHQRDITAEPVERYELYKACEVCKKQLTTLSTARVIVHPENGDREVYSVTRLQFEDMTRELLEKTGTVMNDAIRKACVGWDRISRVLLVGGTTRMTQIERYVEQVTGKKPELLDNRDQIVAHGAALLLQNMTTPVGGGITIGLINTVPHPLATWVRKGKQLTCSVIVPTGSVVPASGSKMFKRQRDSATEIDIPVFQDGTDAAVIDLKKRTDQRFLRKYHFRGIPPVPAVDKEIEVTFHYNGNKTIDVAAVFKPGTPEETKLLGSVEDWDIRGDSVESPLVAVIDCSSSMSGSKIEQAKLELVKVAETYAGKGFTFSVVCFPHRIFDAAGEIIRGATEAREVENKMSELIASGSTPMTEGLEHARALLRSLGADDLDKFVFLITDGAPDDKASAKLAGEALKTDGAKLFAIPIGSDADAPYLMSFCEKEAPISSAGGISQAFKDLLSGS